MLDFDVLNWAAFHRQQIVLFIHLAPIDNLAEFSLQNTVQPNTSAAPVSLSERMGDIHLHIFLDNLVKSRLRHLFNVVERRLQVHHWGKTEVSLRNIDCAQFTGKVVNLTEKVFMDRFESGKRSSFKAVQCAGLKQLKSFFC